MIDNPDVMWIHPKVFESFLAKLSKLDQEYVKNTALQDETGWIVLIRNNETKNL